MATISQLNIRLGLLSRDFERDLARFEKTMQASASRVGNMGDSLTRAFTVPLAAIGGFGVKIAAEFESLQLAMTTTFNAVGRGALEAAQEISALQKAALAPGLDFEQAIKGSVRLQGVGISADRARLIISELGNQIASTGGSADQLDAVTKQLAQVAGKGRLLQEDLSIILENMPGLAKVLRDEFGTTSAEAIRALGVSAEDFIDRITNRMATLPRAAGGLANSLVNAFVSVRQAAANIGEALNKTFNISGNLEAFSNWVIGMSESFANLDDGTKELVIGIGVFVAALGPALKIMSLITSAATTMVGVYARVAESFRITAAAGTGTLGVFSRLSTAAKLSVFVGAAGVVLALAAAFGALALAGDKATEGQRLFADAQRKVTEEVGRETAILNKNFEVLKNTASTTEQRTAAIRELQSTYPDYLRNVDLEKASLTQLTEIQGQLNSEILRSVAERQKAIAIEEQYNRIAQAQLRITQLRKEGFEGLTGDEVKRVGRSLFGTDLEKSFILASSEGNVVRDVIKALERDVQQATQNAKELGEQFDETFQIGTRAANRQYDALTRQRQAVIDAEDALENMTPAQREALKFSEQWERRWSSIQAGTKEASSQAKKQADLYRSALASIQAVSSKGDVLGAEVLTEQAREIETQIERLLEGGFKPYSKEIQRLRDMLKQLRADVAIGFEAPNITQQQLSLSLEVQPLIKDIDVAAFVPALNAAFAAQKGKLAVEIPPSVVSIDTSGAQEALEALSAVATKGIESAQGFQNQWERMAEIMNSLSEGVTGFSTGLSDALEMAIQRGQVLDSVMLAVAESVAQSASQGADSFKSLATAALAAAAKIVRAWIQQGVSAAVAKALTGLPFPANLAAGAIAGAAAAALFNKAVSAIGIPKLASGAVVTEPTLALVGEYPGAASNPEIVTPEKKMESIFRGVLRDFKINMAAPIDVQAPRALDMRDFSSMIPLGSLEIAPVLVDVTVTGQISNDAILLASERAADRRRRVN